MIATLVLAFWGAVAWSSAASAAERTAWQSIDYGRVRLIAATTAPEGGRIDLGLEVKLDPGFKTYWRTPGEAGVPPTFDWSGSRNVAEAAVLWPAPQRFIIGGFQMFGYAEAVVLPIAVTLTDPQQPASIKLDLSIGVCRDICVLGEASLALDVALGTASKTVHAASIARARARVPAGEAADTAIDARAEGGELVVSVRRKAGVLVKPDLFIEGIDDAALAPPVMQAGATTGEVTARFRATAKTPLAGRALTVTVVERDRAIERALTVAAP